MNKNLVFIDAEEKYLGGVILHAESAESVLTYDEAHKNKVSAEDLKNLFVKGLVVVECENILYKPVSLTNETTHYEVIVAGENTSAAEVKKFKSDNITA